ncbi:MAG: hypothetical protein ACJ8G3_18155 [Burkholderiaceae bacterium]
MKNPLHAAARYVLAAALLVASQFATAGLLGNDLAFSQLIFYTTDGITIDQQSNSFTFTAGSGTLPSEIIALYDNGIDLRLQPYSLPAGATLDSIYYSFYNITENFLSVNVNMERTTMINVSDDLITLNNNFFDINLTGLPVDGTAILALDIRTVSSDATAVPEPPIGALILTGAMCAAAVRGRKALAG